MVARSLCLQGVLHSLGRREVGQARLLRCRRGLLLLEDRAAAALDEVRADKGGVGVQGENPARRVPDAAEGLECVLDGKGLAADDELRGRRAKEEREHLACLVGVL